MEEISPPAGGEIEIEIDPPAGGRTERIGIEDKVQQVVFCGECFWFLVLRIPLNTFINTTVLMNGYLFWNKTFPLPRKAF